MFSSLSPLPSPFPKLSEMPPHAKCSCRCSFPRRSHDLGTSYLRIVGPIYSLYGLGMGLSFASHGLGNALWTVTANATRLVLSAGRALIAVYWLHLPRRASCRLRSTLFVTP